MKRTLPLTIGTATLLALAGCASSSVDAGTVGATDNPTVGITTHSVVVSGNGMSPTTARSSATPTPTHVRSTQPSPTAAGADGGTAGGSSGGGGGDAGKPLLSPSGNYYRAGEFCPDADAGVTTVDAHGRRITCLLESGRYHWHYA
ncbi:hypothetical protein [Streptacidiphilus anmyonensis]|uniref:hypothetical protein n=1 Tax=Streptacidiphilus anmyonensis TaxID=405782 RepID=UPI00069352CF|nr:hypothetical protein [Streptacidiphilus anmyonensis]